MRAEWTLCDRCGASDVDVPHRDWQPVDVPEDRQRADVSTYHLCPPCFSALREFFE